MAERLTTAAAVRVLLDGGYLCEMCPNTGKTRKYTVHLPDDGKTIGRITPKQFDELVTEGVIESIHESGTDKYGNVYHFYELRPAETKAEMAREIFEEIEKVTASVYNDFMFNRESVGTRATEVVEFSDKIDLAIAELKKKRVKG